MCEFECEINTASTERRAQIAGFLTDCGQPVWVKCAKGLCFKSLAIPKLCLTLCRYPIE
jgi:hypothetical protein